MSRILWAALAAVLLVAPVASAGSLPVIYYLKDGKLPNGTSSPAGDGVLDTARPPPLYTDPGNLTKNEAQTRMVFPGIEAVIPTQFVTMNATSNQPRIYGPIIAAIYAPKTPLIQNANMSMQLVYIPPGADPTDGEIIAAASVAMDGSNQTLPDPNAFVPPDPTDPEGAAAYIQSQLLIYTLTKLAEARVIAYLDDDVKDYYVDYTMPDRNGSIALRFVLEQGSSPIPAPLGAGQPILYNSAATPSLLFVPWYLDPPVVPPASTSSTPTTPSNPTTTPPTTSVPSSTSDEGKGGPGASLVVAIAAVAAALAVAARRRL